MATNDVMLANAIELMNSKGLSAPEALAEAQASLLADRSRNLEWRLVEGKDQAKYGRFQIVAVKGDAKDDGAYRRPVCNVLSVKEIAQFRTVLNEIELLFGDADADTSDEDE